MKPRLLPVVVLSIAITGLCSTACMATPTMEEASVQEIVGGMANKTVRGVANAATGWIELPKQIKYTYEEGGAVKGILVGPLKGIGMTVARTVGGVIEVATFYLPLPGFFDPIIDPPYPWDKE